MFSGEPIGLKDKHGKEICEGNTITWQDNYRHKELLKIVYDKDNARFRAIRGYHECDLSKTNQERMEIVETKKEE